MQQQQQSPSSSSSSSSLSSSSPSLQPAPAPLTKGNGAAAVVPDQSPTIYNMEERRFEPNPIYHDLEEANAEAARLNTEQDAERLNEEDGKE